MVALPRIPIDAASIADLCRKWRITEFALFGSVLRDDFGPDSDVDVLVTFAEDAPWDLWDMANLREELSREFRRDVDVVSKRGLKNPYRRARILKTRRVVYAG